MIGPDGTETVPGYATDIVTDQSIDWIRERDQDRPFLLLVHHKAPHRPWVPDEKHKELYPLGSIPEPSTLFDDHSTRSQAVRGVRMSVADDLSSDELGEELPPELRGPENRVERMRWKYQRYLRDYLQCVQSIDDNVGRLLDVLDERGPGRVDCGRLHVRPGLLPRRPRVVRQAADVRRVAADADADPLAFLDPRGEYL